MILGRYDGVLFKHVAGDKALAGRYIPHARALIGQLLFLAEPANVQVMAKGIRLKDGTVIKVRILPGGIRQALIDVRETIIPAIIKLRGLVCLPKSTALPQGFPNASEANLEYGGSSHKEVLLVLNTDKNEYAPYYYDYADHQSYQRAIASTPATRGIEYGLNDWRGKTGEILSWIGKPGRSTSAITFARNIDGGESNPMTEVIEAFSGGHFYDWMREDYIYQGGVRYARAPLPKWNSLADTYYIVFGAALHTVADQTFLLAVCWRYGTHPYGELKLFYRKVGTEMIRETDADNTAAWTELAAGSVLKDWENWAGMPNFLFNASGTEGMAVIIKKTTAQCVLLRIAIQSSVDYAGGVTLSATVTEETQPPCTSTVTSSVDYDSTGANHSISHSGHTAGGTGIIVAADYLDDEPVYARLNLGMANYNSAQTGSYSHEGTGTNHYVDVGGHPSGVYNEENVQVDESVSRSNSLSDTISLEFRGHSLTLRQYLASGGAAREIHNHYKTYDWLWFFNAYGPYPNYGKPDLPKNEFTYEQSEGGSESRSGTELVLMHLDLRAPFAIYTSTISHYQHSWSTNFHDNVTASTYNDAASFTTTVERHVLDRDQDHLIATETITGAAQNVETSLTKTPGSGMPPLNVGSTVFTGSRAWPSQLYAFYPIVPIQGYTPVLTENFYSLSKGTTTNTSTVNQGWTSGGPSAIAWTGRDYTTGTFDGDTVLCTWDILDVVGQLATAGFSKNSFYPTTLGVHGSLSYSYMTNQRPELVVDLPGNNPVVLPVGII